MRLTAFPSRWLSAGLLLLGALGQTQPLAAREPVNIAVNVAPCQRVSAPDRTSGDFRVCDGHKAPTALVPEELIGGSSVHSISRDSTQQQVLRGQQGRLIVGNALLLHWQRRV